ncbi:MAG: hypothetical protein IT451_03470 [Candidatus Brocadia sp.]|nr:hypothetical protein [Candidatus Brocadia sp.]
MNELNSFQKQILETPELESTVAENLIPIPLTPPASGLYQWRRKIIIPQPIPGTSPTPTPGMESEALFPFIREELRLDVDRHYPQMVASGAIHWSISSLTHWIASLTESGLNSWTGTIWNKDGDVVSFPYTKVDIQVTRSWFANQRSATATFTGGGGSNRVRTFKFKSLYFHPVDFEFDCAEGEKPTITVDTCGHPNHPATLPREKLSIQTVYKRTGFSVTTSPGGPVPLDGAGPNAKWSDQEMHDAMQTYWSRFGSMAQWAMWVFFASLHEQGTGLGGIMFDDIGPNHRQGTAIFNDAFISQPPAGDPNPTAWVTRMLFWTACHEMGHAFNLAHSWQKSLGTPWIPLADEPEERSFMNYPYNVSGGQTAFFADFEYRFSDGELLFMRHAPARFVQMGNADWFDHHGFQEANVSPEPAFKLELRVNRERAIFEFMEPVTMELKLTNISTQSQMVNENILSMSDSLTVILKKDGKPARQFCPYARYCLQSKKKVLMFGESIYESLFVSAGRNGWDISEPGNYTIQVALHSDREDIVSNPLRLRVAPPQGYDEEFIAQDFFSDDVGRIVAFDGSQFFTKGNDTLHEVTEKLNKRRVALHASLALGSAVAQDYKQLVEDPKEPRKQLGIKKHPAQPEEARKLLASSLTSQMAVAVDSLGHIDFKWYVDRFSDWLAQQGATQEAAKTQDALYQTMSTRQVHGRKVLDLVLQEIKERRDSYKSKK